jgi:hypothetical protein
MKRDRDPWVIALGKPCLCGAATKVIGNAPKQETDR